MTMIDTICDAVLRRPVCLRGCAGSGKTTALSQVAAGLVRRGVPLSDLLLLAFEREAANHMRLVLARALEIAPSDVPAYTIHAYALRSLRLADPDFGRYVASPTACERALKQALERAPKSADLPSAWLLARILTVAANRRLALPVVLREPEYHRFRNAADVLERVQDLYAETKAADQVLDFDDVLLLYLSHLEHEPSSKVVLVDEDQDLTALQVRIVELLAGPERRVLLTGDALQWLYPWRGALGDASSAIDGCRTFRLRLNRRSTAEIVAVANAVCLDAAMKSETSGPVPRLYRATDSQDEARFVAHRIASAIDRGVVRSLSEIAVLYRNLDHAVTLREELRRRGIPFVERGGLRSGAPPHVQDVVAHLNALVSPRNRMAVTRVLKLCEGLGPKSAEALYRDLDGRSLAQVRDLRSRKPAQASVERLSALYERLDRLDEPGAVLETVVEHYLRARSLHPACVRDLEDLVTAARAYTSITELHDAWVLEPPHRVRGGQDAVTLSTDHSAKGDQWPLVFMIHAAESCYGAPHDRHLIYVGVTRAARRLVVSWPEPLGNLTPYLQPAVDQGHLRWGGWRATGQQLSAPAPT